MEPVTTVWATCSFAAHHRWAAAPAKYEYLSHWHRHLFKVTAEVVVAHDRRDIEFIEMRDITYQFCRLNFESRLLEFSCETIAQMLADHLVERGYKVYAVTVSEDGENGATKRF